MLAVQTLAFLAVGTFYFMLIYKVARRRLRSESYWLAGNWMVLPGWRRFGHRPFHWREMGCVVWDQSGRIGWARGQSSQCE
jgi:apolipoprotein N-acyltransferase